MLFNQDITMNFNINNEPIIRCESLIKPNAWIYFEHRSGKQFKFKRIQSVKVTEQEVHCHFYSESLLKHDGSKFINEGKSSWKAINFIDFRLPSSSFNKGKFCDDSLDFILGKIKEEYGDTSTELIFSFEEKEDFITNTTMFRPCIFPSESVSSNIRTLSNWLFDCDDGKNNGHLLLDKHGFPLVATIGQSTNPITEIYIDGSQ